jgi:pyrroline-5-carboxylate reductase
VFTPVFMGSGEGFIGMTFEPGTAAGQKEALREYWGGFGNEIMEVDEKTRDAFTILQSCSQFFLYPVVKAMLEYGRLAGLSEADAQAVSLSTFRCVARELEGIEVTPEKLEGILDYARVPGNMTWEGLKELEGQEVEEAFRKCLAAAERQSELNRSGL